MTRLHHLALRASLALLVAAVGLFVADQARIVGPVSVALFACALIVPLLQIIMFGMGTAMSARDFVGVVTTPLVPDGQRDL